MRFSNFRRSADFCFGSLLNVSTNDMLIYGILMEYGGVIVNGGDWLLVIWVGCLWFVDGT